MTTIIAIYPRLTAFNEASEKLKNFVEQHKDIFSENDLASIAKAEQEYDYNRKWADKNGPIFEEFLTDDASFNSISLLTVLLISSLTHIFNNIV